MTPAQAATERRKIVGSVIDLNRRPRADSGFQIAFDRCDSPIEQAYCLALFQVPGIAAVGGDFEPVMLSGFQAEHRILVFAQQPIKSYRADFLLVGLSAELAEPRFLIVECDGTDYHSKREHRLRDEHRSSALVATGFQIERFPGTMIYREPQTVVRQTLDGFVGFDAKRCARMVDGHMLRKAFWELKAWSGT